MIDVAHFLWSSLIYGAVLSLLLSAVVLDSLRLNPEIWLNDYPEEIRAKFGPMSEKPKGSERSSFFSLCL